MLGERVEQQRPAFGVVVDSSLQQHRSGVVDQGDVVMVVGPVDPAEHCHCCSPSPRGAVWLSSRGRARRRSNGRARWPGIPQAVRDPSRPPRPSVWISAARRARSGKRCPRRPARVTIIDARRRHSGLTRCSSRRGRAPVSFPRLEGLLLKQACRPRHLPIRFSRPPQFSSRGNSTLATADLPVHRSDACLSLPGRVDLSCAHRAGCPGRPTHVSKLGKLLDHRIARFPTPT